MSPDWLYMATPINECIAGTVDINTNLTAVKFDVSWHVVVISTAKQMLKSYTKCLRRQIGQRVMKELGQIFTAKYGHVMKPGIQIRSQATFIRNYIDRSNFDQRECYWQHYVESRATCWNKNEPNFVFVLSLVGSGGHSRLLLVTLTCLLQPFVLHLPIFAGHRSSRMPTTFVCLKASWYVYGRSPSPLLRILSP